MNDTAEYKRRCTDCNEHSGIVAELNSGGATMGRLEQSIKEVKDDFIAYTKTQTARTIAILILVISCLLTGFVSIYVSSVQNGGAVQAASMVELTSVMKSLTNVIESFE